ncbi:hypothetical protein Pan216_01770 [Planctomycetes bacterium Pan216]|uniref:Uncharacterized protein n=1 Tax=Kolteria novifilia TaxID=2527975 RepID=A0A518AX94_9BACT|nr:hypothetical protein Pan216_01770 [Planctomycetes bacterium Pan216]
MADEEELEPAIDDLRTADHVLEREFTKLCDAARELLRPEMSYGAYLKALLHAEFLEDGLDFVGHALPLRHAVWWGCCCIGKVMPPDEPGEKDRQVFGATFRWVVEPTEEHRAAIQRLTRVVTKLTAPILLGRATGFAELKLPEPLAALKRDFRKEGVIAAGSAPAA